jgi:hypothetical protein
VHDASRGELCELVRCLRVRWKLEWKSTDLFVCLLSRRGSSRSKRKFCAKAGVKQKAHSLCSFDVAASSVSCGI